LITRYNYLDIIKKHPVLKLNDFLSHSWWISNDCRSIIVRAEAM